MKKLLILLFSIFFLSSTSVYAESSGDKVIDTIIEEGRQRAENNPGFRDLKPGISKKHYDSFCSFTITCYGIQNIKFDYDVKRYKETSTGERSQKGVILVERLILDMGPIVASDGSFFSELNNLVVNSKDEPNIYLKMKKNFDAKYVLDYEYSERDRQLFNENEKDELLGVYSNGQVVLSINRKERENSYSKDLWLYIEYRDVGPAKEFLEKNRPVTATLDDF